MENKEFDDIMRKYVSGTAKGKTADFAKLNERESVKKPRSQRLKYGWASLSFLIVIALTLAVVLPLTFNSNKGDGVGAPDNSLQYFDDKNIVSIRVKDMDELSSLYQISASMPTIKYDEQKTTLLRTNDSNSIIVGANIRLEMYEGYFEKIELFVIPINKQINTLSYFELLTEETVWRDVKVKHQSKFEESGGNYVNKYFFTKGGYKYCLEAKYFVELEPTAVLDMIFC